MYDCNVTNTFEKSYSIWRYAISMICHRKAKTQRPPPRGNGKMMERYRFSVLIDVGAEPRVDQKTRLRMASQNRRHSVLVRPGPTAATISEGLLCWHLAGLEDRKPKNFRTAHKRSARRLGTPPVLARPRGGAHQTDDIEKQYRIKTKWRRVCG